jgi:hypothetical protein
MQGNKKLQKQKTAGFGDVLSPFFAFARFKGFKKPPVERKY